MTLPSSRFVCWNVAFLHHKLKTSVHADAEAIIVEDVNRWMKTLNESSSYFDLFLQETLLLNFPYTGHSNQSTILTQQFLAFIYKISHIFTRIVRMPDLTSVAALCTIFQQLPQLRLLESLKTPLSFDSAIKRRCKNRGNGFLLVLILVTEARDV